MESERERTERRYKGHPLATYRPTTGAGIRYDWVFLKQCYVEGLTDDEGRFYFPTATQLAEQFDLNPSTVLQQVSRHGWKEERGKFVEEMEHRHRELRIEALSSEMTAFDAEAVRISASALDEIAYYFEGEPERDLHGRKKRMSVETLEKLSRAFQRFQQAGRLAYGGSTSNVGVSSWKDLMDLAHSDLSDARQSFAEDGAESDRD